MRVTWHVLPPFVSDPFHCRQGGGASGNVLISKPFFFSSNHFVFDNFAFQWIRFGGGSFKKIERVPFSHVTRLIAREMSKPWKRFFFFKFFSLDTVWRLNEIWIFLKKINCRFFIFEIFWNFLQLDSGAARPPPVGRQGGLNFWFYGLKWRIGETVKVGKVQSMPAASSPIFCK